MPGFDVQAARKAGYSDDEILAHLTQSRKYDVAGAEKAGYSKPEIIDHLSTAAAKPEGGFMHMVSTALEAINPMNAVREYMNRPAQWKAASDVMGVSAEVRKQGGQQTPAQTATVERAMETPLSNPVGITLPLGSEPAAQAAYQAHEGDYSGAAGTLAGNYVLAPVVYGGIAKGLSKGGRQAIARTGAAAVEKATDIVTGTATPADMATRALKPSATKVNFKQDLNRALPEIKVSEEAIGRPITTVEDMLEATLDAKKRVRAQYEQIMGPAKLQNIDASPVADAIEKTIGAKLKRENPAAAQRITDTASKYRGVMTLDELEQILQDSNAELNAYYAKYPTAQRNALRANPETAQTVATADAARKLIYETLDGPGQGAAPRELNRRYGALLSTEHELYRRQNVANRQAPLSLSEQASTLHAAAKLGRAGLRAAHGDIPGAFMDVGEAMATRKAAEWIKDQNSTNGLIRRTFENVSERPVPVEMPQPFQPAGLLTEGSIKTPAPADTSFVRSVPAQYAEREPLPVNRQIAAPGAPAIVTPAPPDPSGVTVYSGQYPPWMTPPATAAAEATAAATIPPAEVTPNVGQTAGPAAGPAAAAERKPSLYAGRARQGSGIPETIQARATPAPGAETAVRVPGETHQYKARYEVRELEDIQTSHSGETFQPNTRYELKNERNYNKGENQDKVVHNSREDTFDPSYHITDNPDATNGPIVIDSRGNALGGNGRGMILQRVFNAGKEAAGKYRGLLESKLAQFGIDPKTVEGMRQPVLVRVIDDAEFERPGARTKSNAIADFNKKGTAELTPAERAIADSQRVSPATLEKVSSRLEALGHDATLAQAIEGKHGAELLEQLINDGVVSRQERAALVSGEQLTPAGKQRIHQLMLGRFFADPAQLDNMPASLRNKIERAASPLAQVESREGWNLSPAMQEAVSILEGARAAGNNVNDFLKQSGLFGDQKYNAKAVTLARALEAMKPTEITAKFRQYAQDAAYAEGGATMFGEPPTPESAFKDAFGSGVISGAKTKAAK